MPFTSLTTTPVNPTPLKCKRNSKSSNLLFEMKYLNLPANLGEIVKALAWKVKKLSILLVGAIGLPLGLQELKNEWAAGADVGATGKEVAADKSLKDARLAATLATNNSHLRKLDR